MNAKRSPAQRWRPLSFGELLDRGVQVVIRAFPIAWPLYVVLGTASSVAAHLISTGPATSRNIALDLAGTSIDMVVMPLSGAVACIYASWTGTRTLSLGEALRAARPSWQSMYGIALLRLAIDLPVFILLGSLTVSVYTLSYVALIVCEALLFAITSTCIELIFVTCVVERRAFADSIVTTWRRFTAKNCVSRIACLMITKAACSTAIWMTYFCAWRTTRAIGVHLPAQPTFVAYRVAHVMLGLLTIAWAALMVQDVRIRTEGHDLELDAAI